MTAIAEAFVTLRPDMGKFVQETRQGLSGLGQDLTRAGAGLTALSAPLIGLGISALRAGGEFETQMNRVRAVSGATGDSFDALADQAKELGRTTQFTAGQSADAMGFLAMAGFEVEEILAAMPSTLQLAAAAQLDLGRAADITSNILTGYGMEVENLGHANDVLVKAMTATNTDLEMLGTAFKYVGPVAKGAGVSFEEAAAAIGLMGNAGIQGSMAGTSLRGAITRLLNPTKQVQDAMDELGFSAKDADGELLSLEDIVRQLETSGATTADMMLLFGQRAGPAMAALVDQGSEALVDLTAELGSAGGIAERVAGIQMEGFNGAMLRAKSAFEGFAIAIAEAGVLETFAGGLEELALGLQRAAEWFTALSPKAQTTILIIGGLVTALGPLLLLLGTLAIAIGALLSPIGLVVLAITGLIATGLLLWANWDTIQQKAGELASAVGGFFTDMWHSITSTMGSVVTFLRDTFMAFINSNFAWLALLFGPVGFLMILFKFRDKFVGAFEWVQDKVGVVIDWIGGKIDWLTGKLEALQSLAGAVAGAITDPLGTAGALVDRGLDLLPFDTGGIVPGPIGAPIPILAHGGETVLPTHKSGAAGISAPVVNITFANGMEWLRDFVSIQVADATRQAAGRGRYGA